MIRSELIAIIARKNPHLTRRTIEHTIGVIFDSITDHLANAGRVEIRRFGTFSVRRYGARRSRNPRSGVSIIARPRVMMRFRPAGRWRNLPIP